MLAEMILKMLPPPPRAYGPLALSEVKRGETLGCPQCKDPMKPTVIHEVELDHCPKHGVWFDQDELRLTLYRVADPSNPPPFGEWIKPLEPWEKPRAKLPPAKLSPPKTDPAARRLVFDVGGTIVETQASVIKVGRIPSAMLRIDNESVSRMHAVIEVSPKEILVIDLGSASGTLVNGARVTKMKLNVGDVLRFGNTDVRLVSVT
jgi:hypothetical protein